MRLAMDSWTIASSTAGLRSADCFCKARCARFVLFNILLVKSLCAPYQGFASVRTACFCAYDPYKRTPVTTEAVRTLHISLSHYTNAPIMFEVGLAKESYMARKMDLHNRTCQRLSGYTLA